LREVLRDESSSEQRRFVLHDGRRGPNRSGGDAKRGELAPVLREQPAGAAATGEGISP
jgi:hypothetical protein